MNHNERRDERGDAPVIGVVLMVGIAVVLAAAVTAFVFGLGVFGFETVPQAQFSFEHNDSVTATTFDTNGCAGTGGFDDANVELKITHTGGQSIPADQLVIIGAEPSERRFHDCSALDADDDVTNQDAAYIEAAPDDTVRIVWESDTEDNTQTLAKWDGSAET